MSGVPMLQLDHVGRVFGSGAAQVDALTDVDLGSTRASCH